MFMIKINLTFCENKLKEVTFRILNMLMHHR